MNFLKYTCPNCEHELTYLKSESHVPINGIHILSNNETLIETVDVNERDISWDHQCPFCYEVVDPDDCLNEPKRTRAAQLDRAGTLLDDPEQFDVDEWHTRSHRHEQRVSNDDTCGSIEDNDGRFLPANIQICGKCKSLFFAIHDKQKCCSNC